MFSSTFKMIKNAYKQITVLNVINARVADLTRCSVDGETWGEVESIFHFLELATSLVESVNLVSRLLHSVSRALPTRVCMLNASA